MSNLQLRTISGLVLASVVLALTWVGGLPFRLLAVAISAAVFYEWTRMTRPAHSRVLWLVPEACMAILLVALGLGVAAVDFLLLALAATVIVAAIGFLRGADHAGLLAILFLFAVVWTTDTLAYFVGRAVGGPKLAPSISPGKTWSGAIGGTVAGVAAGIVVSVLAGTGNHLLPGLAALLLSVVSQIGDLFESWVKRRHGCKDSSQLIPGHGGVMDRVDGLVVAALALYVIGSLAASPDNPAQGLFGG
jgi:phosphatidate cytidylyltransferase